MRKNDHWTGFSSLIIQSIPEQFTVKAHPALFEREGEGQKKLRNTFQRLRPEEFSSGDFGLRSFRRPEISAWGVFVSWRFRPGPKSPAKNSAFSREERRGGGKGRGRGVNGFKYCLVKVKWRSSRGDHLVPSINSHLVRDELDHDELDHMTTSRHGHLPKISFWMWLNLRKWLSKAPEQKLMHLLFSMA